MAHTYLPFSGVQRPTAHRRSFPYQPGGFSINRCVTCRTTYSYLVRLHIGLGDGLEFSGGDSIQEAANAVSSARKYSTVTYLLRTGRLKARAAYAINFFKSVLLIPPIGLISAEEQSYLVR